MNPNKILPLKISNTLTFSKMTAPDISSVLEILVENNLEKWTFGDFSTELDNPDYCLLIGKIGKEIRCFCIARLIITPKPANQTILKEKVEIAHEKEDNECEIYNFAVKKKYQKQNLGRQMLEKLISHLKVQNIDSIWLEVRISNETAIDFYEKNDFVKIYERRNFYSNPIESAVVMKRDLQPKF